MARKTKSELIEEAHQFGLDISEDENYSDILELVKEAREEAEHNPVPEPAYEDSEVTEIPDPEPDDDSTVVETGTASPPLPPQPESDSRPERNRPTPSGWNSLGVWVGKSR